MLQDVTAASFEAHLGTTFRIHLGGEARVEAVLQAVKLLEPHPGPRAQPFSLFFRAPGQPVLRQAIYTMEHEGMGTLDIFLVPIGPDPKAGGMLYEAVFN